MNGSSTGFEANLRISLTVVAGVLVAVGTAIVFMGNVPRALGDRVIVVAFAVALWVLAAVIWRLDVRRPLAARWTAVAGLAAIICAGAAWLEAEGVWALLALPTALAAALIGAQSALLLAAVESVFLAGYTLAFGGMSLPALVVAPLSIWGIVAVMYAVYGPVYQVARWAWDYYQRAQRLLDETLDRQVRLKQALDDLARANEQLTRLNRVAQGLRQAAEDARTAKEQFVANVSHELRTPLNMITGFSEMIVETPETYGRVPPALLADLDVIHRNAEHLSELIDDVLDLSQIEAGEMALTREQVFIGEVIEVAATAVRPLFDSKGLYLQIDVPAGLSSISCDRTRIREVLLNLLSNAGRFTEHGGVHVCVRQERDGVVVSVADTGTGIASEDLGGLFQPFHQVDGSIRRRYGGTGLGLSISKRFIELHGGEIWVESERGVGTTFTFRLPSSVPVSVDYARWLSADWEYVQRTHPSLAPKAVVRPRLVVLELSGSLGRLLLRYLHDVEIVTVPTLEAALRELARMPAQALLVNDVSVSRTLERLADAGSLPVDTPVLVCSVPGLHESSPLLGVSDRLVKPVSRTALFESLHRLGLRGGTVLIVDDEPDALQLFGRMLASSEHEYRVLLARDGQEALGILEQHRPDVILLDLVMPNLDGFQLLERRSEEVVLRDIPVIVISARDPAGQPIVSSALAVTRGGGLSVHQLLVSIKTISRALSTAGPIGDPALSRTGSG